ncbi:putative bax inhibitor 1-like [Capsicum annuum]|uniref:bax inhibitor 1-like n=1 Tax=Capsicum annuum TaxID=4072 RepID=UPI0007BF2067|nr:bax inhibitor 1-like [Capsicum annuum]KAF3656146.1 putative bax inhibitor 1-like [Capsicum annuum]
MTFLSVAMNAVKAYFKRSWRRRDMMTLAKIPVHYHQNLRMVYRTHFWAMLCATVGSYLHLFWEVGGLFTVLCSVASLLCLCFTSPHRVRVRVSLLMITASSFGASVGLFTKYLFGIDQVIIASLLGGTTIGIGIFWFGARITRQRSLIYMMCLLYSCGLMFSSLVVNAFDLLDSYTAHWMLMVTAVLALFMGYFVVYSQEILYDARYGYIDFVNRTLTIFFRLPVIVVHAARLYLGVRVEQRRRHKIAWGAA